nr:MAG TPA: hypothetical protein [Caudoviricetes sp.]
MNFNSHAHVERDSSPLKVISRLPISTHTLTWSVTRYISHRGRQGDNFNSHAHVERDSVIVLATLFLGNFNSHAHVERDRRNAPLAHLR